MSKKAASKTTSIEEWEKTLAVSSAKKMYVSAAVNMGWQLAIAVLIPVIIGVKLDERFNSGSSYTLAALVLAVGGACMVVWKTLQQTAQKQTRSKSGGKQT